MRSDSPAGLPAALCRDASSPPSARVLGESLGTTELQVLEAAFQRHPGGCRAPAPRAATVLALQRLWMQLGRAALLLQWHPHSQLRLIVSCLFYLLQEAHARDSHVGGVGRVWGGVPMLESGWEQPRAGPHIVIGPCQENGFGHNHNLTQANLS